MKKKKQKKPRQKIKSPKMMARNIKYFFIILSIGAIGIFVNYYLHYTTLKNVEENWQNYQHDFLYQGWQNIQEKFFSLEKNAYKSIEDLLSSTNLEEYFQDFVLINSRKEKRLKKTQIFEQLFRDDVSDKIWDYGIAIFDATTEIESSTAVQVEKNNNLYEHALVAWKNWAVDVPEEILREALSGKRTSRIVYSQEKIYTILCSFYPLFDKQGKCIGSIAISTLLNTPYPLSSRYIKKQNFNQESLSAKNIQEIKIDFEERKFDPFEDSLQQPLFNLNVEHIGWVTLVSKPREIIIRNLNQNVLKMRNAIIGCCCTIFFFLLIASIFRSKQKKILKLFLSVSLIWLVRYIFGVLAFPTQLLPEIYYATEVFSSDIYYIKFLGEWSGSPIDFLLTHLTFFFTLWLFQKLFPFNHRIQKFFENNFPLKICFFIFCCFVFSTSYYFLSVANHSLVEDSGTKFAIMNEIIPSEPRIILSLSIIILGLSFVIANSILIKYFLQIYQEQDVHYFLILLPFISYFFLTILYTLDANYPSLTLMWSNLCFCFSVFIMVFRWPKIQTIRRSMVLFLICISIYPLLYYENKAKRRDTISGKQQEHVEKVSNYKSKDFIENILDNRLRRDKGIIKSIESRDKDAAFLLWANNSILNSYFNNVYLSVYLKLNFLGANLNEDKYFMWEDQLYYHLSSFSSGMALEDWYEKMIVNDLQPDAICVIPGVKGYDYSVQEKNLLFSVGGVPVHNEDDEIIGYVAILTKYKKVSQIQNLPNPFADSQNIPDALLQAYFSKDKLIETNIPYMKKTFSPPAIVVEEVSKKRNTVWLTQDIEGIPHDCFYFPHKIHHPYYESINDTIPKYQEETIIGLLGYPIPSTTFMVFFFLQFFLIGLICVILPNFICGIIYRGFVEKKFVGSLSFEGKLLISFFAISGIPVFFLGVFSKENAIEQVHASYRYTLTDYLNNSYLSIEEEQYLIDPFDEYGEINFQYVPDYRFCHQWGKINRQILNIYIKNRLHTTNADELFQTELLAKRLPGEIYYNLMLLKRDTFINIERTGFIVGYKAIFPDNYIENDHGLILSIPMVYEKARVEREITSILVNIITIYGLCLIVVVIMAFVLIYHIIKPLKNLVSGINRVSEGDLSVEVPISSNDEIGHLIIAFNRMTKELETSRKKLIQAEKNAAWREMSRQIAHEIKNPLTPMKLSAQHILRAFNDQAEKFPFILQKGIANIIDAIDSLAKTATSFSEFAKFTKPNPEKCDIRELVENVLNLFSEYKEQDIVFSFDKPEELSPVFIDTHQVKRVLINIVTNAIHALENGGNIKIDCWVQENFVLLQVKDNGCGVPHHIKERLFEPNFSTKSYGSGLGLAISKRAIEGMNGKIRIESEENIGTVVFIELPIYLNNKDNV